MSKSIKISFIATVFVATMFFYSFPAENTYGFYDKADTYFSDTDTQTTINTVNEEDDSYKDVDDKENNEEIKKDLDEISDDDPKILSSLLIYVVIGAVIFLLLIFGAARFVGRKEDKTNVH